MTGDFSWVPNDIQGGNYILTIQVDDGMATDTENGVQIIVNDGGHSWPPVVLIAMENLGESRVRRKHYPDYDEPAQDVGARRS